MSIKLFSPAKINLFLKVVGRRVDGYHNLESLFQAISLKDEILLSISDQDRFSCKGQDLPNDESNFVIKALSLFRKYTNLRQPIEICLIKKIPQQAGLGGGSSNGATVIWGLNQLLKAGLSYKEMHNLASQVSSDSAFFFSSGTALCKGRGDHLEAWNLPIENKQGWLVIPHFGISTQEVFSKIKHDHSVESSQEVVLYQNDLEKAAFSISKNLKILKDFLLNQNLGPVFMTGSGSALVCLGAKPDLFGSKIPVQIYPFHYINRDELNWYS